MKLQFIEVAGFRGFRDKVRFELPAGFAILTGRNGSGKSSVLDAIDFALTGTISKFSVRAAKGGGLDEHIWWVGEGGPKPRSQYVSVGFVDAEGEEFLISRSRERDSDTTADEIWRKLSMPNVNMEGSLKALVQTALIRDELIAGLSLDLPGRARFAAVHAAIGGVPGPDYSKRTAAILQTAINAKDEEERRTRDIQSEVGRSLSALTEARSVAERGTDIAEALQVIASLLTDAPSEPAGRARAVRAQIADRKERVRVLEEAFQRRVALRKQRVKAEEELRQARDAYSRAMEAKNEADQSLALALRMDEGERETDSFAVHLAALVHHGEAVGLLDGHCPLCNSALSQEEFGRAIAAAKARLSIVGRRLAAAGDALSVARNVVATANEALARALAVTDSLTRQLAQIDADWQSLDKIYDQHRLSASLDDAEIIKYSVAERELVATLERALFILEASSAVDRVTELESRLATLRDRAESQAAKLSAAERVVESARQINASALTVANEILTERFDTVMPLLKELYRRLKPHPDWTEIGSDFGGKVRGTLNFLVGEGCNPQFLFSSGQRRAAGLAYLLAVHMSRPWCRWQSLLLDDPVQHIDDYRAINLAEVLTSIRRTGRQIVIAVEDPALADLLCRRLRSSVGQIGRRFDLSIAKSGSAQIEAQRDILPLPKVVLRYA